MSWHSVVVDGYICTDAPANAYVRGDVCRVR